jgi:hypothetical protein
MHRTREHTSESVKSALISRRHHRGNKRSFRVTRPDANSRFVVHGTLVERFDAVLLGCRWRWKVDDDHLQQGVPGWKEFSYDNLEKVFSLQISFVRRQLDVEFLEQDGYLVFCSGVVHDDVE